MINKKNIKQNNEKQNNERQATMVEYIKKPINLNLESYNILNAYRQQLIEKFKRNFTFSETIFELRNLQTISFTNEEIQQIKTKLKGGNE